MNVRHKIEKTYTLSDDNSEKRLRQCMENDAIDSKFGFDRKSDMQERTGFLINMHSTEIIDENKRLQSAVDYHFIQEDGTRFKASIPYRPYFYVLAKKDTLQEVSSFLSKKYTGVIEKVEVVAKEDLDLPNHLVGLKQRYLKLSFATVTELLKVRRDILGAVKKAKERAKTNSYYTEMMTDVLRGGSYAGNLQSKKYTEQFDNIIDIREYDVPYHVRVSIDLKIFVGLWYTIRCRGTDLPPLFVRRTDLIETPDVIVLAFDIECTKQPLKFPDSDTDQVMMISYMIDGQGYLINNREIISQDVEDFEYTPMPEFEGQFIVYNEPDERSVLERFFDHITDVKPHVIVTYNGDFFDWPFVEARAAIHGINMLLEIGFSKAKDGVYSCRAVTHMDCLCWVKRDSYLPVGSQNLKAVAKAKLRYDPVELDPEDMCKLAAEEPQVLCNYSVSDAVATYYLYMKYVHPFIFALCTIIPMEPDEVLRKGSGTLCETLLMVEAFHGSIVFPNKQESELNKMTSDGHVLDTETYVGGHVEALESGVFRADIPCRFRLVPEAFDKLIDGVERTMIHAITEEEKIPLEAVENLDAVVEEIKTKLRNLRDNPNRLESPVIYHLDVGAMYPNIILTNRLQPSAMVDEETCAACDFNRPGATCQRRMKWMWRGEYMPATRNEFHRIQQQLETEKFPAEFPGGPARAYHQLSKEDQAAQEKKRLSEYCRKAYKKVHVTRAEERETTICQKENSFYVDTVRAFRDRRYEYKGLNKVAKKQVADAVAKGDAREIKSAKNREVLYDSLQLAHKCILNSFYGYVMRRGARWHSIEMAGIVCYTGAAIITKAREIIEQVGRPLELDTDGIWCVLPASFPENFHLLTKLEKKGKVEISYPNAVLNCMVKDHFTNHAYHDLVDPATLKYVQRSENSIFFEVDGPYLAMVLPASKEEGKKLKKRYAVFNFDRSLAELKGFEVKRRGELQLIKIFQSSVFEAFLKGDTLETCYEAVAKVADYWLDVLYSKAHNLPDSELFELVSENRSMSKKLEEYGAQKSTSISTAKRLAEFLGDQMVKDKGLACRFIISRKPEGAPVTERAIPLAIFQAEPSVKRHYLRRWLKDNSLTDVDIRQVLDWNYYIERLNGAIQKIITIPAALQGLNNPVPRVRHPDWLHKKMLEKNDVLKQRKVNEFFKTAPPKDQQQQQVDGASRDIEDTAKQTKSTNRPSPSAAAPRPVSHKRKRTSSATFDENQLTQNWRDVLGPPPSFGTTKEQQVVWIQYQKRKWDLQRQQRRARQGDVGGVKRGRSEGGVQRGGGGVVRKTATIGGFIRKAQRTLLDCPWQVIQYAETNDPGVFRAWVIVEKELHQIRLSVPRIFYVNQRSAREEGEGGPNTYWKKVNRFLPRGRPVHHLYEYSVPEPLFMEHSQELAADLSAPDIEGIYETQMSLEFRLLLRLGCVCSVDRGVANRLSREGMKDVDSFNLDQLTCINTSRQPYLETLADGSTVVKPIFFYHHRSSNAQRALYGVFYAATKRAVIFVVDTVKNNQIPNLNTVYTAERTTRLQKGTTEDELPAADVNFEVHILNDTKQALKGVQKVLQGWRDEKKGPTMLLVQSCVDTGTLVTQMPALSDFPLVTFHTKDPDSLYSTLEWQKVGAKQMIQHFTNSLVVLSAVLSQCRFFHIPIGNLPADATLFGADLFYGRQLLKNNFVLWCSSTELPDLGGRETDDSRLMTDIEDSHQSTAMSNQSGCYSCVCVELDVDALAVNTLLQSQHVNDIEGTSSSVSFDAAPQMSVEDMALGNVLNTASDDTSSCSGAFKVVRAVVNSWLRDVSIRRNIYADHQIVHFYRWLRSPNALLYDPLLRRTLSNLMKKLFIQLIAELKRLGSIIVFANYNKIVICTKKTCVEDAIGYVDYVVASVRNKELFHSIHISYRQCWQYLMWLDTGNYAGVRGKLPAGVTASILEDSQTQSSAPTPDEGGGDDDDDDCAIVMNWNLSRYLPTACAVQATFNAVVAGYISAVWGRLKELDRRVQTPNVRRPTQGSQSQTQVTPLGLGQHESVEEFAKELLLKEMSQKLFMLVQKIMRKLPTSGGGGAFPSSHGSQPHVINPALEFTKAVCRVLSLDTAIQDEVGKMRRDMLRLIGVGEFSDQAVWTDPCITVVLPEVICRICNHCRDIDLCKDVENPDEENAKHVWLCPLCCSAYDNIEIEHLLLDTIQRKVVSYIVQDLQCKKCLGIKEDNMTEHCNCGGEYKALISTNSLSTHVKTLQSIANYFAMPLLLDAVEWLLKMNPSLC